jgi:methionine sulfoxide reductase heme-binding subunit
MNKATEKSGKTSSQTASNWLAFRWETRHLIVLLVAGLGTYAFLESRAEWSAMHRWNRAVGDMSLVLVALSMSIGPLARLFAMFRPAIPWRRELGIYGVLLAIVHTVIILAGWVEWDLIRLFGYELNPMTGLYVMLQHGFGLANVIGILALLYGIVLALASNDWRQRVLSGSVWKFLQQSAYVLWMLIVIHTAYFLYLHFQDFHRSLPDPNWAQMPFAGLVALIILLQFAAFLKTWRSKRGSRRKPTTWESKSEPVAPPV